MKNNPKKYTSKDGYHCTDLFHFGNDHLKAADYLFKYGPVFYDSAGYLYHLGFELILKSICLYKNGYFENVHDLKKIIKLVNNQNSNNKYNKKTLDMINTYNDLRYPKIRSPIEIGLDDLPNIIEFREYIESEIPDEMKSQIKNISVLNKGNRVLMVKK